MTGQDDELRGDLFGPFIDRTFRLVEMVGIVALLAVVIGRNVKLANYEIFIGELMAVVYWLEPLTDRLVQKAYGSGGPIPRLIASSAVVVVAAVVTIGTMPFVRQLTEALKSTI